MEERRHDEHKEELPGNVVQGDGAGDEDDDVGEIETHHAEGGALAADMGWENSEERKVSIFWVLMLSRAAICLLGDV
jgi:hypothetical protein